MQSYTRSWINISFINLLIVASLGVTLRYKIAFSLPFIDQKNFLHAHSHFAFAGWITHTIMALMVNWLANKAGDHIYKKYQWQIRANLVTAYGMLLSFPFEGYGLVSIIFSTLSVFVSYIFAISFRRDLSILAQKNITHAWFKVALACNALSSIGAFGLAAMFATRYTGQQLYLSAIYFFLHFQYNGWFLFACMGFAFSDLLKNVSIQNEKLVFRLFAWSFLPTYLLSILWLKMPLWLYMIVVISAVMQLFGWMKILSLITKPVHVTANLAILAKWTLILSAVAMSVKILLQTGSTIPALSTLAFGFRPIIIGYLHLVLLGLISLFLLGFLLAKRIVQPAGTIKTGVIIFICGIVANELVLLIQSIADINYTPVSFANQLLFVAAIMLFSGAFLMAIARKHSGN